MPLCSTMDWGDLLDMEHQQAHAAARLLAPGRPKPSTDAGSLFMRPVLAGPHQDHRTMTMARPQPRPAAPAFPSDSVPEPRTGGGAAANTGLPAKNKMKCEDCRTKVPHYGFKNEGTRRWCAKCGKANHPGSESLSKPKMCEYCNEKQPSYGLMSENKVRWCANCAGRIHPDAMRLRGAQAASPRNRGPASRAPPPASRHGAFPQHSVASLTNARPTPRGQRAGGKSPAAQVRESLPCCLSSADLPRGLRG